MPQDAFTLNFLATELNAALKGGKVNRIIQPAAEEVVLTVYTGKCTKKLYISVNPACPRIGIIEEDKESPLTAPNFCMLLRKHLLSATLDGVSLVGFDRIIRIDFTASSEFFDAGRKTLFVELMGRYSNVILTENGKVLGHNRGVNFFDNGVRPLIVGRDYSFPPSGDKKIPSDESLIDYFNAFDENSGETLAAHLFNGVQGLASDTAEEIAKRYRENNPVFSPRSFFEFLNAFIYDATASPCVIFRDGAVKDVCAFRYSVISGEAKVFPSLIEAEEFFFKEKERVKSFKEGRDRVVAITSAALKKAKKRLAVIQARLSDAEDGEKDRIKGELILSNIYKIKQGDGDCTVFNYYDNTETVIPLDKTLSPAKNAEKYYKKYNKSKRTLVAQIPQKEAAEAEIAYLSAVLDEIALAENASEVTLIAEELNAAGYITKQKHDEKRRKERVKFRNYLCDGFKIIVGRNNVENDELTFSAKGGDLWLHAKDYHSSHAIIETENREPPQKVLLTAAEICAYYSKGRDGGKVEIVYTKKKYVKKPPKSRLGFCTYSEFKSLVVKPCAHTELLKQ